MNKPKTYLESLWLAAMAHATSFIWQTGEQATRIENVWFIA